MRKRFTFLIAAALMLLTMISQPTRLWGQTYKKVITAPTDWSGEYLLVREDGSTAYVWTGIDAANGHSVTTTISNSAITKPSGAATLTIASMTGGYSILIGGGTNDGKYVYGKSGKADMTFGNSASAHTISIANSAAKIVWNTNTDRWIQCNSGRFRYYVNGYTAVQLYKKAYTVTYNNNGGSGTLTDSNSPYFENSTVTTKTNTFTNGTQSFTGWNTKADGSGSSYAEGDNFTITENTTLYAQWASATAVADPTFSPVAGTYVGTQSVEISCATAGATIYYTTDGSTPNTNSSVYSSAISVSSSQTIKALAVKDGLTDSEVVSATYTIKVATPTFSPVAGTYLGTQTVSINCSTADVTIYYTTNGDTPTTNSSVYSSAISVSSSQTLKAIAVKSGLENSSVGSAEYTINHPLTTMDAIFEASASAGSYYVTFNNWVVTGVNGNQVFVTDGTKGFIIYKSEHGFSVGNIISGTIVSLY